MPSLAEQLAIPGTLSADFVVVRLMQPPFSRYEDLRAAYAPFDRIVREDPDMRSDVILLLKIAKERALREAFVLAGNKAEGCAPRTVFALAERIVKAGV
jgi:hypothetical protein